MMFTLSRQKQGRKVSFKSKKRRCITVNSHLNGIETHNSKTSNSDDVIGNSNPSRINVYAKNSLNKLITLQKKLIYIFKY